MARLEELFVLGATPHAYRPGLSEAEERACHLAAGWMAEAGLEISWDSAGNLFGRLTGREPDLPEVWTGSHLDTVPAGGRFDGALGVVAGIEAVASLARRPPRCSVVVAAFRDEEGWRFGQGLFGSRAVTGALEDSDFAELDADGISRDEALSALGYEVKPPGTGAAFNIDAFVELHIEQGRVLAQAAAPIGIVSTIAAMSGFEVKFLGAADHAGTTPMADRSDAVHAMTSMASRLHDAVVQIPGAVATIGSMTVEPGASNAVPGSVRLTVDARARSDAGLAALEQGVYQASAKGAEIARCRREVRRMWTLPAAPMATRVRAALQRASGKLTAPEIASGAGHDAQTFVAAGVATGMLFVRSLADGVSHAPEEESDPAAIALGTEVLGRALAELAG